VPLSPGQLAMLSGALVREFDANRRNNGYLLDEISRRYEDGEAANAAAVANMPERIVALTARRFSSRLARIAVSNAIT
jgi:hypothetical protein